MIYLKFTITFNWVYIVLVIIFSIVIIKIIQGFTKKINGLKQEMYDTWHNDPDNWKAGVFYFNPKDPRIFPPKRTNLGWTINFANPYSVLALIGVMILIFAISTLLKK